MGSRRISSNKCKSTYNFTHYYLCTFMGHKVQYERSNKPKNKSVYKTNKAATNITGNMRKLLA